MRIIDHVRGNAVAYVALFVALGGTTAYATHAPDLTTSEDIVDGEVKNPDLGANSISTTKIQTHGVTNADLAPNTVTATRLAPESVETSEIKQGNVFNADLAPNSITDTRLAADSVGASEAKPNSLSGGEIDESSLGKVPDADKVDGKDSSEFATNLWAVVNADDTLARGRGVDGVGSCCASPAGSTRVNFDRDVSECAWVATIGHAFAPNTLTEPGQVTVWPASSSGLSDMVNVSTYDSAGVQTPRPYHLVVSC